jgi:hypothetical protein
MQTAIRKPLKLKACPRCGGDVCRMRDTFGFYHQCAQCGREIRGVIGPAAPTQSVASATINMPANPSEHTEKLMV